MKPVLAFIISRFYWVVIISLLNFMFPERIDWRISLIFSAAILIDVIFIEPIRFSVYEHWPSKKSKKPVAELTYVVKMKDDKGKTTYTLLINNEYALFKVTERLSENGVPYEIEIK